ncbi:MAG: 1-deoxy-D-xylulose-5-phosphate reductoisomerase, partial [Deltaproteobacteria bacterium]|nr:1-deoxy-D-xylulose-5-phosphate reductoisomerase [Deltaproteobacteria bacterium]
GKLGFGDISLLVEGVLDSHRTQDIVSIADVLEADRWARTRALEAVEKGRIS